MTGLVASIQGVFDQLNPFNTGNLILYFTWLVVLGLTTMGVWRCPRGFVRLCCLGVNQAMSIGFVLSWTLTALLAYTFWWQSIAALVASLVVGFLLFSPRRRGGGKSRQTARTGGSPIDAEPHPAGSKF